MVALALGLTLKGILKVQFRYSVHLFKYGELSQVPGRSYILLVQRKLFILFSIFFQIHFGSKDLVYGYFFPSHRELHSVPNMNLLCEIVMYFAPVPVIMGRFTKIYSNHFDGKLLFMENSKICYFNFMVSYLYTFNLRVGINGNCKYLSHNNA